MAEQRAIESRVRYDLDPKTTALISIDIQKGFGEAAWEPVPHANRAVANFRRAAKAWRAIGGTVVHVQTYFTPDIKPTGRMTDFAPDIATALAKGAPDAEPYADLIAEGDIIVLKTTFSAVMGGGLLDQLRARGFDGAVVGGLTTPICVQTTVDGLSMSGIKVTVLADACASQAMGATSAEAAHAAAIDRMAYIFAGVETTESFIARITQR
jgi:nicotinamidase-related amidase